MTSPNAPERDARSVTVIGARADEQTTSKPGSRTLSLVHVGCCICDDANAEPVGIGEDFEYFTSPDVFVAMECKVCHLVYLSPRPSVDDLDTIYPANYHAFEFSEQRFGFVYKIRRRLEARRLLDSCRGLGDGGRIIDIGCGEGLYSVGRNGEFSYGFMEDVYWRTLQKTRELVATL